MFIFVHFLHFIIAKCRQEKIQSHFHSLIWAPLLLIYQRNLDVDMYKSNIGEFINRMYHERNILGVWLNSQSSSIFSFSHYNLYKSIWAPLSLMHHQHLDICSYTIHIGEFVCFMQRERGILGIWFKFYFCPIFCDFFIFSL